MRTLMLFLFAIAILAASLKVHALELGDCEIYSGSRIETQHMNRNIILVRGTSAINEISPEECSSLRGYEFDLEMAEKIGAALITGCAFLPVPYAKIAIPVVGLANGLEGIIEQTIKPSLDECQSQDRNSLIQTAESAVINALEDRGAISKSH